MLKLVWNVVKKLFSIICTIFTPLRRLWCRRKRKNSDSILPMTLPTHYPSVENLSPNGPTQEDLSPWDAWDDQAGKPHTVEQYRYYQQQALQRQSSQEEPETDYFSEMKPSISRQKRVLIRKQDEDINTNAIFSKLAISSDIPVVQSPDLGSWEEENNAWEDEGEEDLAWEAENVIKEKRRAERQQRHAQQQRRKLEKEQQRQQRSNMTHLTTTKLS